MFGAGVFHPIQAREESSAGGDRPPSHVRDLEKGGLALLKSRVGVVDRARYMILPIGISQIDPRQEDRIPAQSNRQVEGAAADRTI